MLSYLPYELLRVVRTCPRASVAARGDRYSLGYSASAAFATVPSPAAVPTGMATTPAVAGYEPQGCCGTQAGSQLWPPTRQSIDVSPRLSRRRVWDLALSVSSLQVEPRRLPQG